MGEGALEGQPGRAYSAALFPARAGALHAPETLWLKVMNMSELNVQVEELSPVVRRVRVDVPYERVEKVTDEVYRRLGRTVRLRGYRQGKVPRRVLEKHFASQVRMDVAREVVEATFDEALGEVKLSPVATPAVEPGEVKPGEVFQYSARVEVRPEVVLSQYKGLEVTWSEASVAEKDIQDRLEQMQESLSTLEPIDGRDVAEMGDAADIAYEVVFEGTGRPPQKRDDALVRIDAGMFIEGHGEALAGLKIGEQKEIVETFPDNDDTTPELRGKVARIQVTLKGLKRREVPAIDDELAKEMGKDSLDELKADIRSGLQQDVDQENRRHRREKVVAALIEKNPIEVPPAMVDRAAEGMAYDMVRNFVRQGLPVRDPQALVNQLKEGGVPRATTDVQTFFLLDAVAAAEGIEVSADELQQKLEQMAAEANVPFEQVKAQYSTPDALSGLAAQLKQDKAYAVVEAAASFTVVPKGEGDEAGETAAP